MGREKVTVTARHLDRYDRLPRPSRVLLAADVQFRRCDRRPPSVGAFGGKNVLIGATAASLGGRIGSMPRVEVLANELDTIVRSRFYCRTRDGSPSVEADVVATLS